MQNFDYESIQLTEKTKEMMACFEKAVAAYAQEADVPFEMVLEWLELPELDPMDIDLIEIRHDYSLFEKLEVLWNMNAKIAINQEGEEIECAGLFGEDSDSLQEQGSSYFPANIYFDTAISNIEVTPSGSVVTAVRKNEQGGKIFAIFANLRHPFGRRKRHLA